MLVSTEGMCPTKSSFQIKLLFTDQVNVTPSDGWFRPYGKSGHDYITSTDLGSAPIRAPVLLNQGIVFQETRRYEVSITTGRLERIPDRRDPKGMGGSWRDDHRDNIQSTHWWCNGEKGSTRIDD
jgi:hypothetical protein